MLMNSVQAFIPPPHLKRAFIVVSFPSGKIHHSYQVSFIFEIVQPVLFCTTGILFFFPRKL